MRTRIAGLLALATLVACDGLKEALTAHVDVAARAESRELSVTRLSDLLGNATLQIPVSRETATIVGDLWADYQLLGLAAARGDSINDPKKLDDAALGLTSQMRLRRYMEQVGKNFKADSSSETAYNQASGGLFVARHILFAVPGGASQAQKDSVRRKAEGIRGQVTAANFPAMAKKYSADPGSGKQGGNLGAFRREQMVKPFSDAVAALKPGQISPLVETDFGYHIIQRTTYADAKSEFDAAYTQTSMQRAESAYVSQLDKTMEVTVKSDAPASAKAAARELPQHRGDNSVLATFKGGTLTVGRFVRWVESVPANQRLPQQIASAPDSLVKNFVQTIARNEVMLKKADSAGVTMSDTDKQQLYGEFRQLVTSLWQQLGVDPKQLADSAKSAPEREKLAATRVETYLDKIMAGQAQPLSVPVPLEIMLTAKYTKKVYPAGVDRAVERAKKLRVSVDSARAAQQPRTQVPLPQQPPAQPTPNEKTSRPDTTKGTKRP